MESEISPLILKEMRRRILKAEREKYLSVRLYGEEVGILHQTETGNLTFTYNENNKRLISQNLIY